MHHSSEKPKLTSITPPKLPKKDKNKIQKTKRKAFSNAKNKENQFPEMLSEKEDLEPSKKGLGDHVPDFFKTKF